MSNTPTPSQSEPTCRFCGNTGDLKRGWTMALYCSERCERISVSDLHQSMPGTGPLPSLGWVPSHISREISERWEESK